MYMPSKARDMAFDWWSGVAEDSIELLKRNPFFLKSMGISLQQHLAMKIWSDLVMEWIWRCMGLPSQKEIVHLHEKVNLLERKFSGFREEDLPRKPQAQGPARSIRRLA